MTVDIHANWNGNELDILASPQGLLELVSLLRSGEGGSFKIKTGAYLGGTSNLSYIDIERSKSLLLLKVSGPSATLSGDDNALSLFAKNLENLRLMWAKGGEQHFHFDPESNPILMAPESDAFVVGPV